MKIIIVLLLFQAVYCLYGQEEIFINDGSNIIYLSVYGSGEPMLIINGGPGMHSNGFKSLAREFGKNYMAIIYDQRGTGKSKIPVLSEKTITLDSMIADIETIRQHLGLEEWIVLGHSFGGMLASYYASIHRNRVKGLVLSSSGGIDMGLFNRIDITSNLTTSEIDSLKYWRGKIAQGDTSKYATNQKNKFLASAYLYNKEYIPIVAERLSEADFKVNRLVFKNMTKIGFDCTNGLKDFNKPVLIIQGEQDIIDKKTVNDTYKTFSSAELVYMDKCSHFGWLEQPKIYFSEIEEYISGLD